MSGKAKESARAAMLIAVILLLICAAHSGPGLGLCLLAAPAGFLALAREWLR